MRRSARAPRFAESAFLSSYFPQNIQALTEYTRLMQAAVRTRGSSRPLAVKSSTSADGRVELMGAEWLANGGPADDSSDARFGPPAATHRPPPVPTVRHGTRSLLP